MADVRALHPQTLAAVVDMAMQRQGVTSGRALSRKSKDLGIEISYTVLNGLRSGLYPHPLGRDQRKRLARLAGIPPRVVDQLEGVRDLAPFELPDRAAELRGDQRTAVLSVVNAFLTANEAIEQAQGDLEMNEAANVPLDAEPADVPPDDL